MIKFFIRTTKQRKLNPSYNQIDYELLIDTEHNYIESFINQLEYISDYDAVLLEDDVWLCNGFNKIINDIINEHPNTIINFFTLPLTFISSHLSQRFMYNQCTYYPKGIGKILADKMRSIYTEKLKSAKNYHFQYDEIESQALTSLGIPHYIYRPSIVQHLDLKSLIQDNNKIVFNRTTLYFIDYLIENNIKYEDAFTNQNKQLLSESRHKFFDWAKQQDWWS